MTHCSRLGLGFRVLPCTVADSTLACRFDPGLPGVQVGNTLHLQPVTAAAPEPAGRGLVPDFSAASLARLRPDVLLRRGTGMSAPKVASCMAEAMLQSLF